MKTTNRELWLYLAQFRLELEMFQTKGLENIKTHFMSSNVFPENRAV
jgi:hypothetical protein